MTTVVIVPDYLILVVVGANDSTNGTRLINFGGSRSKPIIEREIYKLLGGDIDIIVDILVLVTLRIVSTLLYRWFSTFNNLD